LVPLFRGILFQGIWQRNVNYLKIPEKHRGPHAARVFETSALQFTFRFCADAKKNSSTSWKFIIILLIVVIGIVAFLVLGLKVFVMVCFIPCLCFSTCAATSQYDVMVGFSKLIVVFLSLILNKWCRRCAMFAGGVSARLKVLICRKFAQNLITFGQSSYDLKNNEIIFLYY